jgi:hypothetical protein
MNESTNYRTINIKLRRIDVIRIRILLSSQHDFLNTNSWMYDLHKRLVDQCEKFDKKLEEKENDHKTV